MAGDRCPACGKLRYLTKRAAKLAASRIRGRKGRVHPYRCGDFWHLGHPPRLLQQGLISRDQVQVRRR